MNVKGKRISKKAFWIWDERSGSLGQVGHPGGSGLAGVRAPAPSMYPAIQPGDRILTTRLYDTGEITRGDTLVFQSEELDEVLVKRVIGLPGDGIVIKETGEVFVNGERLAEEYVEYPDSLAGQYLVPEDSYYFLGDFRVHSFDSRKWNQPYIPEGAILGEAKWVVTPLSRFRQVDEGI